MSEKEKSRRMGDTFATLEMDATINRVVELIATPMETPEQQNQLIREGLKLQLNTYMVQRELLGQMAKLLDERAGIISRLIDKGLVPFLYFIGASVLYLIANNVKLP